MGLTGIAALEAEMRDRLAEAAKRTKKAEAALAQALKERDEARAQAVWATRMPFSTMSRRAIKRWVACAPGGLFLREDDTWGPFVDFPDKSPAAPTADFPTNAEALAAGRALPWWEVKA